MKKRRLGMKIFLIVLICIFALVFLTLAAFGISYQLHTSASTEMLGKEETVYTTKDNGCRIANVPYDEYLKEMKTEKPVTPEGLSEKNSPEENSAAIEKAVDEASKTGGTVYIPAGTYKISTVKLKSNITLFVEKGAVLLSQSYDENKTSKTPLDRAVILAENCENITVTGGGTIDGNGLTYTNEQEKDEPLYALRSFNLYTRVLEARKRIRMAKEGDRANILRLENCKNVTVDGIILKDSAFWTAVFSNCEEVTIRNLIIDSHLHIANGDGIDITGGRNYEISHCFIATADDGIVLKSIDSDISHVTVSDCTVCSFANNFKIGTETEFDISDITVRDCFFFMPDGITGGYSGLAVESADGANVKNISISNIEMQGVSSPLLIWLGNRLRRGRDTVGSVENVTVENIKADNVEMPSAVTGVKGNNVKSITLKNFDITYRDTEQKLSVKRHPNEMSMSGYPEITRVSHIYFISHKFSKYWSLPCYGLFTRNTENLTVEDFQCKKRTADTREEFFNS